MPKLDPFNNDPIGPVVRVLAGVFLAVMAALLVPGTLAAFQDQSLATCPSRRFSVWCELGNLALSLMPTPWRGPARALTGAAFVALLGWLAWWMLKPVLPKRRA